MASATRRRCRAHSSIIFVPARLCGAGQAFADSRLPANVLLPVRRTYEVQVYAELKLSFRRAVVSRTVLLVEWCTLFCCVCYLCE